MRPQCGLRAALTERRRGARGDSPHLHQNNGIPLMGIPIILLKKVRGIEPGPGMNDSPVGCQNWPDRASSRRERRFPSPPPNERHPLWVSFHLVLKGEEIEPGPVVNDVPVARQSRADRGASSAERRFPSPPPNKTGHLDTRSI